MNFRYIRKYKNKKAKRNAMVIYDHALMRIASTSGDGLRLRSESIVHPNDEGLIYEKSQEYEFALKLMKYSLDTYLVSKNWEHIAPEGVDLKKSRHIAYEIIRTAKRNLRDLPINDESEK